jgi:hypothetical protein
MLQTPSVPVSGWFGYQRANHVSEKTLSQGYSPTIAVPPESRVPQHTPRKPRALFIPFDR